MALRNRITRERDQTIGVGEPCRHPEPKLVIIGGAKMEGEGIGT